MNAPTIDEFIITNEGGHNCGNPNCARYIGYLSYDNSNTFMFDENMEFDSDGSTADGKELVGSQILI